MPFIDPKIIENPIIFQMLKQALGSNFFGHLPYGCNTAFPGSKRQNVHRDSGHIFPEIESPMPPLLIVVNIALDDFTANNGATEIYLVRIGSSMLTQRNQNITYSRTSLYETKINKNSHESRIRHFSGYENLASRYAKFNQ